MAGESPSWFGRYLLLDSIGKGGFGSVHGALVAGIVIGILQVMAGFFVSSQLKFVPAFAIYLLVVLLRPRGLAGRV